MYSSPAQSSAYCLAHFFAARTISEAQAALSSVPADLWSAFRVNASVGLHWRNQAQNPFIGRDTTRPPVSFFDNADSEQREIAVAEMLRQVLAEAQARRGW